MVADIPRCHWNFVVNSRVFIELMRRGDERIQAHSVEMLNPEVAQPSHDILIRLLIKRAHVRSVLVNAENAGCAVIVRESRKPSTGVVEGYPQFAETLAVC